MKNVLEMFFSRRRTGPSVETAQVNVKPDSVGLGATDAGVKQSDGSPGLAAEAATNEMVISLPGQAKVGTVKNRFHDLCGLTLRIYDGRSFAALDKTIGQVRKKTGAPRLVISQESTVSEVETQFLEECGVRVQIAGSDDTYLCDNDLTLKDAVAEDKRKIGSRRKRYTSDFKDEVAQAASLPGVTLASVAERYGVSTATVYQWKVKHAPGAIADNHDGGAVDGDGVTQREDVDLLSLPLGYIGTSVSDYVYAGDNMTWGDSHRDLGMIHVIKPAHSGDGAWDFIRGTDRETVHADDVDYLTLTAALRQLLPDLDDRQIELVLWIATEDEYGEADEALIKEGPGAEFAPDDLPDAIEGALIVGRTVWRNVSVLIDASTGDVNVDDDDGDVEPDDDTEICAVLQKTILQ